MHERDLSAGGEQVQHGVHPRVVDVRALQAVVEAESVEREVVEGAARLIEGVGAEPEVGGAQRDREPFRSPSAELCDRVVQRAEIVGAARSRVRVRRHEARVLDPELVHRREAHVEVLFELGRARLVPPGHRPEVVVHVEAVHASRHALAATPSYM